MKEPIQKNQTERITQNKDDDMEIIRSDRIDELFDVKVLTADHTRFQSTPGGFMSLEYNGNQYERVAAYRSFPFSEPFKYISIRETNPKAEEIGMILDLNEWPQNTRELILSQLEIRYFIPIIEKITNIKEEYGFAYWEVVTNRGKILFTTSIWSPVTKITEMRLLVTDLEGNRFEISDLNTLSPKEKKLIDLFL
jgi:hypothetical protein